MNILPESKGRGMLVDSLWDANGKAIAFTHQNNELRIDLLGVNAGDIKEIHIGYHGIPADGLHATRDKFGTRGFFSDNWPDKAKHWLPVIDHPHEKASCEMIITAPMEYQVVSNGLLIEQSVLSDSMMLTHWKQSVPISSWLYTLGISRFAMKVVGYYEGKPVQSWVYAAERDAGFRDMEEPTLDVLRYFSTYVGPFAYEKIANIESPVVGGGMEAASAIGYSEKIIDGKQSKRIRNVIIHELAHQWFGNAVTEQLWDDVWLSESFATYFTLRYIEHAYGREEFLDELQKAKKLFQKHLATQPPYPIVASRDPQQGPVTEYAVTYQKGAWVLYMLNSLIGEKAFHEGIREYYRLYYNATATTADLIRCMQQQTSLDLERFFRQWLKRPDQIQAGYSWKYDAKRKMLLVEIEQEGREEDAYEFLLPFQIVLKGDVVKLNKTISRKKESWQISCKNEPEKVLADPDGTLLGVFTPVQ
jgi:aminopeptidase N